MDGFPVTLWSIVKRRKERHDPGHPRTAPALPTGTDAATIDAAVATFVRPFLTDVLSFPNVTALMTWQLSDKYTWLAGTAPRPLPFDSSYQPKVLAYEIERAMMNAPPRPTAP
ncbi:endo-1,4-beta-xylanase [Bradyrhizobium sp. TZ2]